MSKFKKHRYKWVNIDIGVNLHYAGVVIGHVRPNCRDNYPGSPNEGWFWSVLNPVGYFEHYGFSLVGLHRPDMKLKRKQDAMDELLAYYRTNLRKVEL